MAAGLGFKDFTTGEVLTAADVDGYLMQGVWVFASAAARDAAVTSPQEGNFAYLKDTNVTTYYTGSAWANLDTTGMTNPMTTAGDLIYGGASGTPTRLAVGSTGNVLTVSGGNPVWAAAAASIPTNSVASVATNQTTTSSTYTDLTTSGPAVTLTTGTKALVILYNRSQTGNPLEPAFMSFAVSGASTVAATDTRSMGSYNSNDYVGYTAAFIITGLTAGSNTFTCKYRQDGSTTGYFQDRVISVVDMGS